MTTVTERTLVVTSPHGLGNRLRPLLSGMVLAEASQRHFSFLWTRTAACGAGFHDLFKNDWQVQEVTPGVVDALPTWPRLPDVLADDEPKLTIRTPYWLLTPSCHPAHPALMSRCAELLAELQPIPEIARKVTEFQASHFRPRMIGVHLRRGDFTVVRRWQANNLGSSFHAVDKLLARWPDAGVLLCSDDITPENSGQSLPTTGVHAAYQRRYGPHLIVRRPSSLDRSTVGGVQEALVDLWLLRSVDAFVGTLDSSFSDVASFERQVPIFWAEPDDWRYQLLAWLLMQTGIVGSLQRSGCRRCGREVMLLESIQYYAQRLRRKWKWINYVAPF
ncbi:hypothetical protein EYB53_000790 [Candidatus Chloroploca sp. M-50]|uniref:Glycosyl transferase family 11 n=1 Tax=Candidatus Chloroploca mongolica TaxID=2528176 RepID=A0ABS4D466_9CHLR|nr:hypothetical protein [Candidatus Chloroploca mongolica]MBP1464232.1 hypothetical protein [Candidatus Chloroploca mongolica]